MIFIARIGSQIQKAYVNDGDPPSHGFGGHGRIIGMIRYIYKNTEEFSHHQRLYYLYDSLGSVSVITGENGLPLQNYTYSPYGSTMNVEYDTINGLRFVGRYGGYKDDDTGLTCFWHRWYDSRDGRWISRDPSSIQKEDTNITFLELPNKIDLQLYNYVDTVGNPMLDLNLYSYAFNRPTFWRDSSGLCPDTGCTEKRNCDKTDNNDDLGNCLKNAKDNYLKGLAVYFGVTAPFHEAVVIGCATTGLGFMACMSSVGLILEIPDLIAIGSLTIGYLQIRNQCFDRYGCKKK